MNKVFQSLRQALFACSYGQILLLFFGPFILTFALAAILFFTFGTWWSEYLNTGIEHSWFMQFLSQKWQFFKEGTWSSISYFAILLVTLMLLIPFSYLLSVLLVSAVLLPMILKIIERKDFPGLEKKKGGSGAYGLWNAGKIGFIYLFSLLATLPLWLFPGAAILLPILLSAYLNKNVFVYDVLQDFASEEERQRIEKENWGSLYILGIILGFLNYIPLAFVLVPTFASLAYSYFCLNALKNLRENHP